ncbi:relaxase/mobilization nuclease domain-containing protein [Acetobacterium wieringae]|uniref:Relaxase/mobilization nuclease domain-containing protein n=1 Tax=Acetobacterium wieringae TaxID=52694 RepID=A0ABY6HLD7_9FIRM|nr:relaxase/mobilization nuclease domain-containing protein [Acetobacterium wieringae]UYO64393.1 relaxase/mobilization nuclease domain-containing protein [Acetobacterium wieringae]VUZ26033.1 Uncharacterised protein [Acetobacterium wieringae]
MAIIKMPKRKKKKPQNKYDMKKLIDYVKKHESENGLVTGFNCNAYSAYQEFMFNKKMHKKENGRLYIHMIQSFPKDLITPEKAFELGQRLISEYAKFSNFQIVMGTHTDKEHIHNHFCINSVGLDGYKWQLPDWELNSIREKSCDICREENIPIWWDVNNKVLKLDSDKYQHKARQGEFKTQKSWYDKIREAVQHELISSVDYNDFKHNMIDNHGITINERGETVTYYMEGMNRAARGRMLGLDFEFNKICDIESAIKRSQKLHTVHQGEYEKQKQGKSWKYELFLSIKECTKHAHNQEEFVLNMSKLGFSVQWDHLEYITFTTPEGKKCQNNKFYPTKRFTKDYLLDQFAKNAERRGQQTIYDHQRQMDHTVNMVKQLMQTLKERGHLSNEDFFPLTHIKGKLEGQALIDKAIEKANSSYDWENEL